MCRGAKDTAGSDPKVNSYVDGHKSRGLCLATSARKRVTPRLFLFLSLFIFIFLPNGRAWRKRKMKRVRKRKSHPELAQVLIDP